MSQDLIELFYQVPRNVSFNANHQDKRIVGRRNRKQCGKTKSGMIAFCISQITWVQCVILAFSEYYVQKHERGDRALILPWVHFIRHIKQS